MKEFAEVIYNQLTIGGNYSIGLKESKEMIVNQFQGLKNPIDRTKFIYYLKAYVGQKIDEIHLQTVSYHRPIMAHHEVWTELDYWLKAGDFVPIKSNTISLKTFKSDYTEAQLRIIFDGLLKNDFIAKDSNIELFVEEFTEKDIATLDGKITWLNLTSNRHSNKQTLFILILL